MPIPGFLFSMDMEQTGFRNHPFQVKDNEELQTLCNSIREYGVLSPLLERPVEHGYEIVSGHRRRAAALKLGLESLGNQKKDKLGSHKFG